MNKIVIALVSMRLFAAGSRGAAASGPVVIVELFTSEGCSCCPPAEEVQAELATPGAIANDVQIAPPAIHVDYWNNLGWVDPFSSAALMPAIRLRDSSKAS